MNSTFLHPEQIRRYFESRLPGYKWNGRAQASGRCPFHDDGTASFSLNVDAGVWCCHAGCGSGGVFDFEEKFTGCDRATAKAAVGELLGMTFVPESEPPEATYLYRDALGGLSFRKQRYKTAAGDKYFICQQPAANGKDWVNNIQGIAAKPLYHLPELIRSTYVICVEGEKDADRLTAANLSQFDPDGLPVAVVCNYDGAGPGKWRPEYSPHFIGKTVTIIPDNDAPGEAHALATASGVQPFAAGVKIVRLPGLPERGDVSDYLDGHTAEELIEEIKKAPEWRAEKSPQFKQIGEIIARGSEKPDFIIPPYVERTSLTSTAAKIKYGKTSLMLSACKAVLTGSCFLGQPTARGSVVMVTEQSGNSFIAAAERAGLKNCEGLWVMQPHGAFGLDWPGIVAAAVEQCKRVSAVLLCIDTLNWYAGLDDENSAAQMLKAMRPLQAACGQGWGVWISVHERKSGGEVSDAARGSSAAGGVADVLMSLRKPEGNHSETIRKISSISRFPETPSELVIDWSLNSEYVVVGDSDAVTRDRATRAVMAVLPIFEESAKTVRVLQEETGESRRTILRVIKELKACRLGDGEKGTPFRYWLRGGGQ